jgi:[protein-PII] uridylyltransferase
LVRVDRVVESQRPRPAAPSLDLSSIATAARSEEPLAMRRAIEAARAALAPSAGPRSSDPGSRGARTLLIDAVVRETFATRVPSSGFAVLAVGGYGRRELAPRSDVDLLLVRRAEADPVALEPFIRALWDANLEVGSAVRTLAQVEGALGNDLHAATATLQGRLVAGERASFEEVRRLVLERFLPSNAARFARAKIDETAERHQKRGGTIFLLAPDLKEGRGMLRDLELARLLAVLAPSVGAEARLSSDASESDLVFPDLARADEALALWLDGAPARGGELPERARALARADGLLAAARACVHELEPESKDRLGRSVQERAAERFGYKDRGGRLGAENLLRDVFLAAKTIDRTLRLARDRIQRFLEPSSGRPSARSQRIAPGIVAAGGELALEPAVLEGPDVLRRAAELFLLAQKSKRDVALATREAIRRTVSAARGEDTVLERVRSDPEVVRQFREILGGGTHVAATLRAMHDAGFLGELLPEFGALDGLAQADTYHAYTVDEHTLAAVAALEGEPAAPDGGVPAAASAPPEREDRIREELFFATARRDLLRLGLLLHDAGKTGGDLGHVERGVALVPDVARRLGLSLEEERHVRFLVEHHLTLSSLADKRDVDAPETRAALLAACEHDTARLDHLYLLTCADVRAVSPHAFTRWKDSLLTRLYEQSRAQASVEVAHPRPASRDDLVREIAARLPAGLTSESVSEHLDLCPRPYLAESSPEEAALHVELAAGLAQGRRLAWRVVAEDGFDRLYVAARDRPRLFAGLCGALAAEGLNIVAASAFTRRDGIALDRFAVVPAAGGAASTARWQNSPPERWAEVARTLELVAAEGVDPAALVDARARRLPLGEPAPEGTRRPPVRVRISNKISPKMTVVDVSAPDRVGLLHDLARALSDLSLDIRLAKIATKGERVADVFYVTTTTGEKVTGAAALARLRRGVEAAARR